MIEDKKQKYEPPLAMRLDEMRSGSGTCTLYGSGDSVCDIGISATDCMLEGNGAIGVCESGNDYS